GDSLRGEGSKPGDGRRAAFGRRATEPGVRGGRGRVARVVLLASALGHAGGESMKRCRISWFSLVLVLLGCTSTEPGAGTAGTRETNGSDPQVPGVPGDDNPSTAPGDDPTSPSDTPGNDPSNPGSDPGKSGGDPSKPSDTPGNDPSNPGDTPSNDPSKPGDEPTDPGTPVSVPESPRLQEERATIRAALSQVADLTAPDLIERHAVPFQQAPEYDLETVA